MKLTSLFAKPVDRPIEGVIKADDEAGLRQELDEYVITNEVEKRLEGFLEAYTNYENANGVWISGFFGSGKSHLLKMLALVLENRAIDGVNAAELFIAKCQGNAILQGDMKRAVAIPSRSILFNIDQKADVMSKTQTDALVAVFVKVFDEMCGYYGKLPYIAQFERDLDSRGLFAGFQAAFEAAAGKPWQVGREQALLEGRAIATAYAHVSGDAAEAAQGILDRYRKDYRLSIDDFAAQVQAYIDAQGKDFRLNFFVDEAGQYIADNTKLMTNLQTVAETLATRCRGRAWVLVTAQEDMNTVVGELGKQQSNDFTKIQARFKNRMKLTSADVEEVIQKRLLAKTDAGIAALTELYHAQANNFRTLFDFVDGAATYRNFQDRDHFIQSYPFTPYQFALFQAAIFNLSQHNAFEGRHSSVGERSMLGVFQQVAKQLGDKSVGQLATFDAMFEGIRTALKSSIQRTVIQAERHLDHPLAVRVLKALFLVKYVREFKPTPRNIRVLLQDAFEQDLPRLQQDIEEALGLLEQQTYIQRNGDLYEFLTDEEKDVEEEIKNTDIGESALYDKLDTLVFDAIVKQRKLKHDANGQDYAFARKLDGRLKGREHELSIHVVTPFHELVDQLDTLKLQSVGQDELVVVLPPDERFARDLMMYLQTERYVNLNVSSAQQETTQRILADKRTQNHVRETELQLRLAGLLGRARLIVHGAELEIGGEEPVARIVKGFQALLKRTYPNMGMLPGVTYTENDVGKYLRETGERLLNAGATEAEQEAMAHILANKKLGVRTTMKSLLERFERKPYGWYYAAILCTVAKLCASGKLEARHDGALLEPSALEKPLRSTAAHATLVLEPQEQISPLQVRALKDLYTELFNTPAPATEARALVEAFTKALRGLIDTVTQRDKEAQNYPFKAALTPLLAALRTHEGKPAAWFFSELPGLSDAWLDQKEQVFDPITRFLTGPQRTLYDEARAWRQAHAADLGVLSLEADAALKAALDDPACYQGNVMQQLKARHDTASAALEAALTQAREQARKIVSDQETKLAAVADFQRLAPVQQAELREAFARALTAVSGAPGIAAMQKVAQDFVDETYPDLLVRMNAWLQPAPPPTPKPVVRVPVGDDDQPEVLPPPEPPAPKPVFVKTKDLPVPFDRAWLADAEDVDRYLAGLRAVMLAALADGKHIQV
jgi:hypothetical protein